MAFLIIRKADKIQYAHMDTLFQLRVGVAPPDLLCVHFTQVEQGPGVPLPERVSLHLHIDLGSVLHQGADIQDAQLLVRVFLPQRCGEQHRLPDSRRVRPQQGGDKALSHLGIVHQPLKAHVHGGKHDKIVIFLRHSLLLSCKAVQERRHVCLLGISGPDVRGTALISCSVQLCNGRVMPGNQAPNRKMRRIRCAVHLIYARRQERRLDIFRIT